MAVTPDMSELLGTLLSGMREVFQARFVGLYLYGSLASGDFDADVSDIDLLAVTSSSVTPDELAALGDMHEQFARRNPRWDDRIDAVYLGETALRNFRTERAPFPVISPGEPLHMRDEPLADWLQNWYLVRESGVTLFGPPAAVVIPPIAHEEFLGAIRRYVTELEGRLTKQLTRSEHAYSTLSMCRALYVFETGEPTPKARAGRWTEGAHPQWSALIGSALAVRADPWSGRLLRQDETVRFAQFVSQRLRASAD